MNSEANDKENGLERGEKVVYTFGRPGWVTNNLSKSKNGRMGLSI